MRVADKRRRSLHYVIHQVPLKTRRLHGSLAEQAYLRIRERILNGDLALGQDISRRKLAAEYGVSFVPIMEALQRLENEGLVESRPRVGTRVRVPTARDIREHYVLREALECQAARLFAEKASADERRELARIAAQLDDLDTQCTGQDGPPKEALLGEHRLHMHLHNRLVECTGCAVLIKAVELNQTLVFKWLFDTAYKRPPLPARWHSSLVEGVSGNDPGVAEEAMRRHVRHGLDAVLEALTPLAGLDAINGNRFASGGPSWRAR